MSEFDMHFTYNLYEDAIKRIQRKIKYDGQDAFEAALEDFGYVHPVRCASCVHCRNHCCCNAFGNKHPHGYHVEDDDYCAWGVRRKEGGK